MLGTDFHDKELVDHVNIFSFRLFCNAEYDQHGVQQYRTWQYNDESSLLIVLKLCRTSCLCFIMSCESSDPIAQSPSPPPELKFKLPTTSDFDSELYGWSSDEIQSKLPTDILLITANDHEFNACYSYMKHVQRGVCKKLGYVYFGQFGDQNDPKVRVALMKCWQGPAAALIAVKNAAEILNPKVVLFVGICASMKPTKAKLGDVVISAKLATYDDKKIKENGTVEHRGTKANVSRNMARLILNAADGWKPPLKDQNSLNVAVHRDAVMLSGSDSVDSLDIRQKLAKHFPDALGLEMEGAGLLAAAYDIGMEWAVVKAVSDFADGSKEKTKHWQPFSSAMAASVVYNMFKYPVVLEDWPHHKPNDVEAIPTTSRNDTKIGQLDQNTEYKAKRPRTTQLEKL